MGLETIVLAVVFAASAAVAYTGYQKAKKAAAAARDAARGHLFQVRQTAMPRRIIYGRTRVGGLDAYVATSGTNNEYLHYILIWGDGPCEAVEAIQFDGVTVGLDGSGNGTGTYSGLVHVESALGSASQTAISQAVTEVPSWTSNDRLLGICYSWIRLKYDPEVFSNGVPNISAIIQGRNDVYDPRLLTTAYTDNVVLCCNHYLTLPRLGPGLSYSEEIDEDTLAAAANVCDEFVAISTGGTERRYTFNGVVSLDQSAEDIIGRFRTAMAGTITYISGRWKFYAGAYTEPTFTISESMLCGPVRGKTRVSKRQRLNTVRGVFTRETDNWYPTDFPAYVDDDLVTADGEELSDDMDLLDTNSPTMARRIAKIQLYRSRYSRQVSIRCNIEAWRAQPGLPIIFNFPSMEFDNTPMDVLSTSLAIEDNSIYIDLELRETNRAIFDWTPASEDLAGTDPATTVAGTSPPAAGANTGAIAGGLNYTDI